jgi:predicted Zn-dependent peptidase
MRRIPGSFLLLTLLFSCGVVFAEDKPARASDEEQRMLADFEQRTSVHKLANGLTIVICERHEAPVFSFYTLVNSGSVQDPKNETGLAHMFEHMAFKGTDTIGTTDYPAEREVLDKIEVAYKAYDDARHQAVGRDEEKIKQLQKEFQDLLTEAEKYVVKNEFAEIVEKNGGVGLNASTSDDETVYFYSFPVNRVELWAFLESERFRYPVMREFYKERDVVIEERRMRVDSEPTGRLVEQFTAQAFVAHPYHHPGIGWISDLNSFSATDAMRFFNEYYVPSNMTIAVVGDVKAAEIMPVIEKYFGRLPTKPIPYDFSTVEPAQNSERRVDLEEPAQPFYLEGYHRPAFSDPDDAVYDVISDLMSNGRTSRLYRSLVRDQRIAAFAAGFSGLPGIKYPSLFAFYAVPIPGHKPEELAKSIHQQIELLKTQDVSDDELKMVKTRAKADLIRGLGNNSGLASQLSTAQARYGDWRELFRQVERIDKVTKEDIRRVANKTFTTNNRTVGIIETAMPPSHQPRRQSPSSGSSTAAPQGGN